MTILRTGVDLIEIDRLPSAQPRIRARFMARVYTPQELAEARESYPSLAGKFAAKEAVSKALGTGIGPVRWQDIEILHGPHGEPVVHLHGAAQTIADRLGLAVWSVSISHSRSQAVAVVVATGA
jgi:holo-[acyl-carrier protein] synthase